MASLKLRVRIVEGGTRTRVSPCDPMLAVSLASPLLLRERRPLLIVLFIYDPVAVLRHLLVISLSFVAVACGGTMPPTSEFR